MVVENTIMTPLNQDIRNTQIIIFTRFPIAGKAKTRLIPALGYEGAAQFQRKMTEYTVRQALNTGGKIEIRYTGGTELQMREWLGENLKYVEQGDGDLGKRMNNACKAHFKSGAKRVLIIGSDCPDNRTNNMVEAINLLKNNSCVIGPATDGGYYLIGMNRFNSSLFSGIDWGTDSVLRQTLAKIKDYKLLQLFSDVDEKKDIPLKISVIIPALNEEKYIKNIISQVLDGFNTEAIVVDGGSSDHTRNIALDAGGKVIISQPGRALQMNLGAKFATGDILLFLHADSVLPDLWDYHIRKIMKQPNISLGFFKFGINVNFPAKKLIEWGTNFRSYFLNKPYGDQGLFMKKNCFNKLKGFPDVPILEDLLMVKKAKKIGKISTTGKVLLTSGRRWIKYGILKTTLINQYILIAAWMGADLASLSHTYYLNNLNRRS